MGPQDAMPPFRRFAFMEVPDTHRTIFRIYQPANYLQLVEQGSDSSHVGILHSNDARPGWLTKSFSRSEEHTSELQSLMRISYAVFCLKKNTTEKSNNTNETM